MSESPPPRSGSTDPPSPSRRRRLLNWLFGLSLVSFGVGLITPLKDLSVVAETVGEDMGAANLVGQRLVYAHAHEQRPGGHAHEVGAVVRAEDLGTPDAALVFPENLSQQDKYLINLHHLEPDKLEAPTDLSLTTEGLVAYSAVCTHLGCTASWTTEDHEVGGPHDHCPCHVGEFDPYRGGAVVGGPPPRPLPQLGVTVNDAGEVEISAVFTDEVGSE